MLVLSFHAQDIIEGSCISGIDVNHLFSLWKRFYFKNMMEKNDFIIVELQTVQIYEEQHNSASYQDQIRRNLLL